jgi:hypothetical protein
MKSFWHKDKEAAKPTNQEHLESIKAKFTDYEVVISAFSGDSDDSIDTAFLLGFRNKEALHPLDLVWGLYVALEGNIYSISDWLPIEAVRRPDRSVQKILLSFGNANPSSDNPSYRNLAHVFTLIAPLVDSCNDWLPNAYEQHKDEWNRLRETWIQAAIEAEIKQVDNGNIKEGDGILYFRRGSFDPVLQDMYAPEVGWFFVKTADGYNCVDSEPFINKGADDEPAHECAPRFDGHGGWRAWRDQTQGRYFQLNGVETVHYVCSWFDKDYDQPRGAELVATTRAEKVS